MYIIQEVEYPSSSACYLPVHWAAAAVILPSPHCYHTALTVSLCLRGGFCSPSLSSVASHLAFPSRTSEKLSSPNFDCLTLSSPHILGLSRELQEDGTITAVLQDSMDEQYLAPSSCHNLSELHQSPNSTVFLSEEHMECSGQCVWWVLPLQRE
jgi:hypothetical protein